MLDGYDQVGVSATKQAVHKATKALSAALSGSHFCRVMPDVWMDDPDFASITHSDGVGTKAALAYLYWRETGDMSVWEGIAQDALVMNTDDMLCSGVTTPLLVSSTIGRNTQYIPDAIIEALIAGTQRYLDQLTAWGVAAHHGGGETADLDTVRTLVVDAAMTTRLPRKDLIDMNRIQAGDVIVGFAADRGTGSAYNSGIASNGLTLARYLLLKSDYATKYPESHEPARGITYAGKYSLTDPLPRTELTIGQALLSPTPSYLPMGITLLKEHRSDIHAMIHCTGSGTTKLTHCTTKPFHYVKDNVFAPPPLFDLLLKASGNPKECYQVFNMGCRLEVYTPEAAAEGMIQIAAAHGIEAQVIGRVEHSLEGATQPTLDLTTPEGDVLKWGRR